MSSDHDLARAESLIDLGRHAQAEALLRTVLIGEPESDRALTLLAETLLQQDQPIAAVRFARSAVAIDPQNAGSQVVLARALADVNPKEATAVARAAVGLAPSWWQTHHALAWALLSGDRAERKEAVARAKEAVRLAPHVADTHNILGLSLQGIDSPFRARDAYDEALRLDPQHTGAMNNLATLQMQLGNLRGASALLASGLGTAPQEDVLRWNHDALLIRLAFRWLILLTALAIGLGIFADPEHDLPYWPRPALLTAAIVLGAAASNLVIRRLPGRSWFHLSAVFRRLDGTRKGVFGAWAVLLVATAFMGVAPRAGAWAVANVLMVLGGLLLVAVWIAGVVNLLTGSSGSDR